MANLIPWDIFLRGHKACFKFHWTIVWNLNAHLLIIFLENNLVLFLAANNRFLILCQVSRRFVKSSFALYLLIDVSARHQNRVDINCPLDYSGSLRKWGQIIGSVWTRALSFRQRFTFFFSFILYLYLTNKETYIFVYISVSQCIFWW